MKCRICTSLVVVAQLVAAPATAQSTGWAEVRSSRPAEHSTVQVGGQESGQAYGSRAIGDQGAGDRLWVARAAESLEKISQVTTGSASHAASIARYNGIAPDSVLRQGQMLQVPAHLALKPDAAQPVTWRVQEFDSPTDQELLTTDIAGPAVKPIRSVDTRELDLFVGQVDVLGEVSVSRVAVGQGSIIRAEVLKSGELMVIAQNPGSSSLRLWHHDGRQSDFNIRVHESDPTTRVRMEPMIRMRVRMVEFRKSALGRLGIDWSDSINGPGFATAGDVIGNNLFRPDVEGFEGLPNTVNPFSTYFGIATNVTSRINLLASNGDAVTLAEPVLTARNGGTASFLAGGEVPYPSVGTNGQTVVQFKEYGIKLNVAPRVDQFGHVHAMVETEISQLDQAVSVQGAPGLLTRRAETQVNVRSGETIVISGLLSSDSSDDIDRLPGIGNLPVIGALFKSESRRSSVSELVIFVTPEVVEPENRRLAVNDQLRFDQAGGQLRAARGTLRLLD